MARVVLCFVFVIARKERSEGRGNPSCLGGTQTQGAIRLLRTSGSPRAFSPRDDNTLGRCEEEAERSFSKNPNKGDRSSMDKDWIHRIAKIYSSVGGAPLALALLLSISSIPR